MRIASLSFHLLLFAVLFGLAFMPGACSTNATVGKLSMIDRFLAANVPGLQPGTVKASCNPGEQMVSGGYSVTPTAYSQPIDAINYPLDLYPVVASYPSSPTSWTVTLLNRAPGSTLVIAHVECVAPSVGIQVASFSAPLGTSPLATACPNGFQLTGGGWQVKNLDNTKAVVTILSSQPSGANGWRVDAHPARGSLASPNNTLNVYAVCAANTLTTIQGAHSPVKAPPGPPNLVTFGASHASCGANQLLTGAGFSMDDIDGNLAVDVFFPSYAINPSQWAITMFSLPDSNIEGKQVNDGGTGFIVPICASVGKPG